jgi:hypothetical protein
VGAVELYDTDERTLDAQAVEDMMSLTRPLSRYVLRRTLELASLPDTAQLKPHARRRIHQATGFVIAQLGLTPDDATAYVQKLKSEQRYQRDVY